MLLSDIFQQLTHGELSQVSLGARGHGIPVDKYPAVVAHVNLGLLALHTRFNLRRGMHTLPLVTGTYVYTLPTDCLKVLTVKTDLEQTLALNERENVWSCMTPTPMILQVPVKIVDKPVDLPDYWKASSLVLEYRQSLPSITVVGGFNPSTIQVDLPATHLQALLLFIAARVHAPGDLSGQNLAKNAYYSHYEAECQRLENAGFRLEDVGFSPRFARNGWI